MLKIIFALTALAAGVGLSPVSAAEWVGAGDAGARRWGLNGGIQVAVPAPGPRPPGDGPRGLLRIGSPVLPDGGYDLINFIAVEPVVRGRRGYSELERSRTDGKPGRLIEPAGPARLTSPAPGVEQLEVELRVERFDHGAEVSLTLALRSDAPDEAGFAVRAAPGSAPLDACILTATMGNRTRARQLWLRDGVEDCLVRFGGHRGTDFTPHARYPASRLPLTPAGDLLAAVTGDEADPAAARPFSRVWYYGGAKVTQTWRKPRGTWTDSLHAAVNARATYWMSDRPIPGGPAFENFELQEPFRDGQSVFFGVTRRTPRELGILVTNRLGMELMPVPAGTFLMGAPEGEPGDADERPRHEVAIARPFLLAAREVSNAEYEQFDPAHRVLRGARGLSAGDDEAVVNVSWTDAEAFCRWITEKEGRPYRLPTEAEWEYACRAGTTSAFHAGAAPPEASRRSQKFSWDPQPVSLRVGQSRPNAWGLREMHGNVEEWCADGYGPYVVGPQTNPLGRSFGVFRVTRGGSHNTEERYLRSANRLGALPEDRHWLIGFRVAQGPYPDVGLLTPLPPLPPPRWARDVSARAASWKPPADPARPYFAGPIPFVVPPAAGDGEPFFRHNHCPAVAWCDNGDLLAAWFSTEDERGREMTILASRLRAGAAAWEPASEFFKAPDRNMTGTSLLNDGAGTLYHLNGVEAGAGWANLALVVRTSRDHGATWSAPRFADPGHQPRNQAIAGLFRTKDGRLVQPCDAVHGGGGGTAVHISADGGRTWADPGAGTPAPVFAAGKSGGSIAGIHAGVAELAEGRWLAFGRGDAIAGRMPMSVSADGGRVWTYAASPWPPISGGQRLVLLRLREGPLLFVSFTDASSKKDNERVGLEFRDAAGRAFRGFGLFAALSDDDGGTWPARKLITPGRGRYDGGAWTKVFETDATHAEPKGYLAATQTPDGVIHLLSSALHYRVNLAWLRTPAAETERVGGRTSR